MDSSREKENDITVQLLRSRFDASLLDDRRAEAYRIIDLAWQMGYKYVAAQMVISLEQYVGNQSGLPNGDMEGE